jgi:hypothetical protein
MEFAPDAPIPEGAPGLPPMAPGLDGFSDGELVRDVLSGREGVIEKGKPDADFGDAEMVKFGDRSMLIRRDQLEKVASEMAPPMAALPEIPATVEPPVGEEKPVEEKPAKKEEVKSAKQVERPFIEAKVTEPSDARNIGFTSFRKQLLAVPAAERGFKAALDIIGYVPSNWDTVVAKLRATGVVLKAEAPVNLKALKDSGMNADELVFELVASGVSLKEAQNRYLVADIDSTDVAAVGDAVENPNEPLKPEAVTESVIKPNKPIDKWFDKNPGGLPALFEKAGLKTDTHESDLLVEDTPEARAILESFEEAGGVTNMVEFEDAINGSGWIELPFQNMKWFKEREEAGKNKQLQAGVGDNCQYCGKHFNGPLLNDAGKYKRVCLECAKSRFPKHLKYFNKMGWFPRTQSEVDSGELEQDTTDKNWDGSPRSEVKADAEPIPPKPSQEPSSGNQWVWNAENKAWEEIAK